MLQHYYKDEYVQNRIINFLGGTSMHDVSTMFIKEEDPSPGVDYAPYPVAHLQKCMQQGCDIGRSLWDRDGLIVHFDIDYANYTYPGEPYICPTRVMNLLQPVVRCIQQELLKYCIYPIHLLSGKGHHFIWKIPHDSQAFTKLKK